MLMKACLGRCRLRDRRRQGFSHGMARRVAGIKTFNRIMPPSEPDLAQRRLAHRLADARDLDVEGIERQKMRPQMSGAKREAR